MIGENSNLGGPNSVSQTSRKPIRISRISKSKTAFMGTLFKPDFLSKGVPKEVRLSRRFGWREILSKTKEKDYVHVNTAYKRKADKVKPVDLGESTGETPGGLANWWEVLWARRMEHPELIESDPPHRYDAYITPRFSRLARGSRLTPEQIQKLKISKLKIMFMKTLFKSDFLSKEVSKKVHLLRRFK